MRFGLHLIRKVIKKKSFLIRRAYHSRVLKPEQTEMMEGEGVREQGTGEPGGKEEGGREGREGRREAKRQGTDKVGLVLSQCRAGGRWKRCCSKTERRTCSPAALQRENFNLSRKRRSLPTIFNPLEQTSRPFFKQSIPNCFFLVPGLSNRCSRKGSRLRFISTTPNIAPGANKCVWFPQAALNRAVAPPSIHRWLPSASPGALQLRRGV